MVPPRWCALHTRAQHTRAQHGRTASDGMSTLPTRPFPLAWLYCCCCCCCCCCYYCCYDCHCTRYYGYDDAYLSPPPAQVRHPRLDHLSFTGSGAAGRALRRI